MPSARDPLRDPPPGGCGSKRSDWCYGGMEQIVRRFGASGSLEVFGGVRRASAEAGWSVGVLGGPWTVDWVELVGVHSSM